MALSNLQRVGAALDLLNAGLIPFVERELKVSLGDSWLEAVKDGLHPDQFPKKDKGIRWDTLALLNVLWKQWNSAFRRVLGQSERTLVSELIEVRNKWAHQDAFTYDDTYRALDSVCRLLQAVSAEQAAEVEAQRDEVLRVKFDEQRRAVTKRQGSLPLSGNPDAALKPWREVVTPHPDVASGIYLKAEFAADLWQVYKGGGPGEYKDPTEFFRRTFITQGIDELLVGALKRLGGKGSDPVIELQTNFGGGKTHTLLALYHLFSGAKPADLPGVDTLLAREGLKVPSGVNRAIFVGTKVSPGKVHEMPDGTSVRTMWGLIAWQLGGKEGYKLVADADRTGTNPGDALKTLFDKFAPCVILIDEWVAYARQLHGGTVDLPAGTFDTQFTFAQTLSEAAAAADRCLLVVSIPSSENEIGGEWGQKALDRLKNAIHRVESPWRPASPDEGFEIVRRRLFQPITGKAGFSQRDAVARAFVDMYGEQRQEFPAECREAEYKRRMEAAYPIHPELFDRLYKDWSTLDKFQRTRGVLRLMAAVIHCLWERQDSNLLIMPSSVPIDDQAVQFELTRYMDEQWVPVIAKDVDGPNSLPLALDRENPNLGRYSACRRVARTVYMGSAPLQKAATRGIDDRLVKLGCVQPGESVATFGDALRRLADHATYLYLDGSRYWYTPQPSVAQLARDRANQLKDEDVSAEIERRLKENAHRRGDFARVHVCATSRDIPDDGDACLVVLAPECTHVAKSADSPAMTEAKSVLTSRGTSPRTYQNGLVFLAPDETRLDDLKNAVRQYLAWQSIVRDRETLNLDAHGEKQAETAAKKANDTASVQLPEAYQWLLVPGQPNPQTGVEWTATRLQGQDDLAVRAAKRLKKEESLLTEMGGTRLRLELDRVPLWRGDNVGVKQLTEDFAKYLYLPRLKDSNVLIEAIEDGVRQLTDDTFAYAEGWDERAKRYVGLKASEAARVILDARSVVVKPEVARRQMDEDAKKAATTITTTTAGGKEQSDGKDDKRRPAVTVQPKRFHATVRLDPTRLARDAGEIAQEVVQHLTTLEDAEVEVNLEIQAKIPGGVTDKTVRDVTENCRTLRFDTYEFEKE